MITYYSMIMPPSIVKSQERFIQLKSKITQRQHTIIASVQMSVLGKLSMQINSLSILPLLKLTYLSSSPFIDNSVRNPQLTSIPLRKIRVLKMCNRLQNYFNLHQPYSTLIGICETVKVLKFYC
jgi:hypothetical protein